MSLIHLLGLMAVVDDGTKQSAELSQLLTKAGMAKTDISAAHDMLHEGEKLLAKFTKVEENRIVDHNVHVAGSELEMWSQTVRFLLRKKLDAEQLSTVMGTRIHAHDHTVTIVAQSLRLLAAIRTDSAVQSTLGDERKVRDIGTRGWALLHRLLTTTGIRLTATTPEADAIQIEIEKFSTRARTWAATLDSAAKKVGEGHLGLLGLLGHVPDGLGVPVGGTAFNVVLHERGQTTAPKQSEKRPTSGWSIGRQGRNSENLGKGWVEPTFQ